MAVGAEYSAVYTVSDGTNTFTLNATSGDTLLVDPAISSGLDMAPVRSVTDDKPQADGGIVHDAFKGPRHMLWGGWVLIRSAATELAVVEARNTLLVAVETVLTNILRADGTISYTVAGGSSKSLTVRCDVGLTTQGGFQKQFAFGLVAANPDWA